MTEEKRSGRAERERKKRNEAERTRGSFARISSLGLYVAFGMREDEGERLRSLRKHREYL